MAHNLSAIKKIVTTYVSTLATKGIRVQKAILYGSQASGRARTDSDIDLIIISRDLKHIHFPERLAVLSRATLHIHAPLEVIGYTPDEVRGKEGKSIFWDEICATGRVIYEAA